MILPDLDSLRCFDAAVVHLNFRKAAKAVALSPAAFSDRLRRLEELLGSQLFTRTTRRVALTEAGEKLLPHARRTLESARACLGAAGNQRPPFALMVGTRFELGLSWLTPLLGPLREARPDRTIHLHYATGEELVARTREAAIDACITSTRIVGGAVRYEKLHEEEYVFVAGKSLLRRKPLRSAEQAERHVLLDLAPDLPLFRYLIDAWSEGSAWPFARTDYLGTIGAVRLRLLEGDGVAVLPRYFVAEDLRRGRLAEILPGHPLQRDHFRLIWRDGHPREVELRELAAELRRYPLR